MTDHNKSLWWKVGRYIIIAFVVFVVVGFFYVGKYHPDYLMHEVATGYNMSLLKQQEFDSYVIGTPPVIDCENVPEMIDALYNPWGVDPNRRYIKYRGETCEVWNLPKTENTIYLRYAEPRIFYGSLYYIMRLQILVVVLILTYTFLPEIIKYSRKGGLQQLREDWKRLKEGIRKEEILDGG